MSERFSVRGFKDYYPKLGKPIYLDPLSAVIGNVELGDHVSVWPYAVIRGDPYVIRIGSWTNIQDNCVVHGDTGYETRVGEYCVIGHGAIVHGCTIGDGCMIDNLVQIGHNVKIGKHCVIVSQVGISGSTEIEDYAVLAGQVGVAGHLKIGRGARIAAQSGLMKDVAPGAEMMGSPAVPLKDYFRQVATLSNLSKKKTANES